MNEFKFQLGETLEDKITKFSGKKIITLIEEEKKKTGGPHNRNEFASNR